MASLPIAPRLQSTEIAVDLGETIRRVVLPGPGLPEAATDSESLGAHGTRSNVTTTIQPSEGELPRCIRCRQPLTREVVSVQSPANERWFECCYCHRISCIRVVPLTPAKDADIQI
jgi:hypothetical protein